MKLFTLCIGLMVVSGQSYAALGTVEKSQIEMAADLCDNPQVYGYAVGPTQVVEDGAAVGYQGVYNYTYTTIVSALGQAKNVIGQVKVVSEHVADIDTTPVSYTFKVISVSSPGVTCRQPQY